MLGDILNFGHWLHFWGQQIFRSTLTAVLLRSDILAMFYPSFHISRERAPVSVHTRHTPLGGNIAPPPPSPDVNLKAQAQ